MVGPQIILVISEYLTKSGHAVRSYVPLCYTYVLFDRTVATSHHSIHTYEPSTDSLSFSLRRATILLIALRHSSRSWLISASFLPKFLASLDLPLRALCLIDHSYSGGEILLCMVHSLDHVINTALIGPAIPSLSTAAKERCLAVSKQRDETHVVHSQCSGPQL